MLPFFRPRFLQQKSEDELEPPVSSSDGEHFVRLVGDGWRPASSSARDTPALTASTSSAGQRCHRSALAAVVVWTVWVILCGHS